MPTVWVNLAEKSCRTLATLFRFTSGRPAYSRARPSTPTIPRHQNHRTGASSSSPPPIMNMTRASRRRIDPGTAASTAPLSGLRRIETDAFSRAWRPAMWSAGNYCLATIAFLIPGQLCWVINIYLYCIFYGGLVCWPPLPCSMFMSPFNTTFEIFLEFNHTTARNKLVSNQLHHPFLLVSPIPFLSKAALYLPTDPFA
jgi:hypothetical protein